MKIKENDVVRAKAFPILQILQDLGIDTPVSKGKKFQYSCSFHGDGRDKSKSARVYLETNSVYCWGCAKARDTIGLVMDAMGIDFPSAVSFLIEKYDGGETTETLENSKEQTDYDFRQKPSIRGEVLETRLREKKGKLDLDKFAKIGFFLDAAHYCQSFDPDKTNKILDKAEKEVQDDF